MAAKRRALAQRRRAVGHTQEELAALLHVERSTVVRWEAGDTEPQPWCRPKLAKVLAVSLDALQELLTDLDDFPTQPAQPSDTLLLSLEGCSPTQIGALMERFSAIDIASRRTVLREITIISGATLLQPVHRWLAQELAVVPLVSSSEPVGNDALNALERAVALFRRWDASGMGGLRRKAVVGQLNAVAETLHESHSPAVSQRLFHITAELAQLAGWMAFDQGYPGVAQRYYLLALSACREARAPLFGAKVLGDMARLSLAYSHYEDSLDLVRTALYIVPRRDSALVRTELLGVESKIDAYLGDQSAATRAADACRELWQDAHGAPAQDWQRYMNQAQVDVLAADAYIELALRADNASRSIVYAERAEPLILNVRESRPQGFDRSRVLDEIRLAKVRLAQRDVAESVTVAQAALELAAPMSSTIISHRLLRLGSEMTVRYPDSVHIIPLRERIHDYEQRVAPRKGRGAGAT